MALSITSLNTGSNGNCFYVGNQQEAVLIDAGISCRETEKRMARLGLNMRKVKAIMVSHEHSDHIRGLAMLSKKHRLPVYVTQKTMLSGGLDLDTDLVFALKTDEPQFFGDLMVTAFPKLHDASEPHSFVIKYGDVKVGIFTDIGFPCEQLIHHFKDCHAAFLESNYDEQLLEQGNYPQFLKNRIRGGRGHLSNQQALQLFINHRAHHLSHLILSHLSANNNCPELVDQLFRQHARNTKVIVASRSAETPLFHITGQKAAVAEEATQLSLHF